MLQLIVAKKKKNKMIRQHYNGIIDGNALWIDQKRIQC